MPKAILEYQLPEEQSEFDMDRNAGKYYGAIWEMYNYLRSQIKYADRGAQDNIEGVWTRFHQILDEEGIELP